MNSKNSPKHIDSGSKTDLPNLIGKLAANPKKIFFSYGHDHNRELVARFKADLEKRGHTVWQDIDRIGPWSEWREKIADGIKNSEMAIAFLSIHSTRDPGVCRNEIAMALHRFGMIYPLMVEQVPPESIPVKIDHLHWPDLSEWRMLSEKNSQDFEDWYTEKFCEIVNRLEGEETKVVSGIGILRKVLKPYSFDSIYAQHLDGFVGRDWLFNDFADWLENQPASRVFWLKAGPGFGKTAWAVNLANMRRDAVICTWFCNSQSVELKDPARAVMSFAFQLAIRLGDYRVSLLSELGLSEESEEQQIDEVIKGLAKKNLDDLFTHLISTPLSLTTWGRAHKLVILVDALDEATHRDGQNPLTALIAGRFQELPSWICFAVTSRPESSVIGHLQGFHPFEISEEESRNTDDLVLFAEQQIKRLEAFSLVPAQELKKTLDLLLEKADGMILYLRMVFDGLRERTLQPDELLSMQHGIAGLNAFYHRTFASRFTSEFEEMLQPFLRLVIASPGLLPLDLAADILGCTKEQIRRVRRKIGSYLDGGSEGVALFHKTLQEWLASESAEDFYTDADEGRMQIEGFLWECFVKREKDKDGFTKTIPYEKEIIDWLPSLAMGSEYFRSHEELYDFAVFLKVRGYYEKASSMFKKCISCRTQNLGEDHPETLRAMSDYALHLRQISLYQGYEKPSFGDYLSGKQLNTPEREESSGLAFFVWNAKSHILGFENQETISAGIDYIESLLDGGKGGAIHGGFNLALVLGPLLLLSRKYENNNPLLWERALGLVRPFYHTGWSWDEPDYWDKVIDDDPESVFLDQDKYKKYINSAESLKNCFKESERYAELGSNIYQFWKDYSRDLEALRLELKSPEVSSKSVWELKKNRLGENDPETLAAELDYLRCLQFDFVDKSALVKFFERINVPGNPKELIIEAGLEMIPYINKNEAIATLYNLIKYDEYSINKNILLEKRLLEYLGRAGRHAEAAAIIKKQKQQRQYK